MSLKELSKKNWNYELEVIDTLMARIDVKLSVHRNFGDDQSYHRIQALLANAHIELTEKNVDLV